MHPKMHSNDAFGRRLGILRIREVVFEQLIDDISEISFPN
jgi:hypothetical protein